MSNKLWKLFAFMAVGLLVLAACGGGATEAPAVEEPPPGVMKIRHIGANFLS